MNILIGFAIVFASVLAGFLMEGGKMTVLMQLAEFMIIGGAGIGSMVAASSVKTVLGAFKEVAASIKGNPYTKETYAELLTMLFEFFQKARKEGLMAVEADVENPEASELFARYPFFVKNHHAISFLADTMKVVLTGTVNEHDLGDVLEMDLEQYHEESMLSGKLFQETADSMPGFGIVAAVLGVVITMGKIDGEVGEIGNSVAAALVGTFLGVLLCYGVFGPIGRSLSAVAQREHAYLAAIKTGIIALVRGDAPVTCIEYARRNIDPEVRPSFVEMEERARAVKQARRS